MFRNLFVSEQVSFPYIPFAKQKKQKIKINKIKINLQVACILSIPRTARRCSHLGPRVNIEQLAEFIRTRGPWPFVLPRYLSFGYNNKLYLNARELDANVNTFLSCTYAEAFSLQLLQLLVMNHFKALPIRSTETAVGISVL